MKRTFGMVMLLLLAAGLAYGGKVSDDFNDGIRNTSLWKVDAFMGATLVETNGHLCACTGTNPPGYRGSQWILKPLQKAVWGNVLEVAATVRCPQKPLATNAPAIVYMNLGWFIPGAVHYTAVNASVLLDKTDRYLALNLYHPDGSLTSHISHLPTLAAAVQIKLRYNSKSGIVGLYWREDAAHAWALAQSGDLLKAWNLSLGTTLYVKVFAGFLANQYKIPQAKAFYFDDFSSSISTPIPIHIDL